MKKIVVNVYKEFCFQIAVLLCGPSRQISIANALTNFRDTSEHVLTLPLVGTIVRSQKSKKELRFARAYYLSGSITREKVDKIASIYKGFTLSHDTYGKSLSDFQNLTIMGRVLPNFVAACNVFILLPYTILFHSY